MALHLDAVSDYVPALDDGLALDYGPVPDNEAARNYGKAFDYDAQSSQATAPHDPAADRGTAPWPGLSADSGGDLNAATPLVPAPPLAPGLAGLVGAPGRGAGSTGGAGAAAAAGMAGPVAHPVAGPVAHPVASPVAHPVAHPAPDPEADPVTGAAVGGGPAAVQPWEPGADGWVSPATYWRRRVIALIVGIAVLAVLAWAVSGALPGTGTGQGTGHGGQSSARPGGARPGSGSRTRQRSGSHSGRTGHAARENSPQSLPGTAPGGAHTASRVQASRVQASRVKMNRAGAGQPGRRALSGSSDVLIMWRSRQRAAAPAPRTTPRRSVPRPPGRRATVRGPGPRTAVCGRGDVVLSLVTPRYWYERGRWPLFGVDAVSTGSRPCRFNMGSKFATVVVTSGRHRIWGSADCVRGAGSRQVVLSRGVPAVRWVFWDRATSIPGCRGPGRAVGEGAYAAIAFDGQLSSQMMVLLLGRPGAPLP